MLSVKTQTTTSRTEDILRKSLEFSYFGRDSVRTPVVVCVFTDNQTKRDL